jgi:pimeloyl-ACP methyl ester carboxylesterase
MTTRTIRANGVDFACIEAGRGPLVLLLHGFPDTAHTWDPTRAALAEAGFRAVSPFMRGYAPTEIPSDGDYRVDTLAADAAKLIEALGEDKAIVVGHDWGASAAYGVANLHPERVRLLVTLAIPHPASLRPTPRLLWRGRHFLAHQLRGAAARLRANDFAGIDELWRRWSPAWDVPPEETRPVKQAFAEPGRLEAALGYYRAAGVRVPPSNRGRIRVPSVAFAGASDYFLAPAHYEKARRYYENSYEVVTLPGGHFLHREHPAMFIAELLRCLVSYSARPSSTSP